MNKNKTKKQKKNKKKWKQKARYEKEQNKLGGHSIITLRKKLGGHSIITLLQNDQNLTPFFLFFHTSIFVTPLPQGKTANRLILWFHNHLLLSAPINATQNCSPDVNVPHVSRIQMV